MEVANWLTSRSFLIPYRGRRAAFFHQSITEFLAAGELARRYVLRPKLPNEVLEAQRWDQSLFLTLSLLPAEAGKRFLREIIDTDLALALTASKYLEGDTDELVALLLSEIPGRVHRRGSFDNEIERALTMVGVSTVHEPQLRAIMAAGDMNGAAAAARLVELRGASVKNELLESLVSKREDYNYCCNGIAQCLGDYIHDEDVGKLVELTDIVQGILGDGLRTEDSRAKGCTAAVGSLLGRIEVDVVASKFLPPHGAVPELRAEILCDMLYHVHSTPALELAGDLLLRGVDRASVAIYFVAHFCPPEVNLSWASFGIGHVDRLMAMLPHDNDGTWALHALQCICIGRPDLSEIVRTRAYRLNGLLRATLVHCASGFDQSHIFEALRELPRIPNEELRREPIHLLAEVDLDWTGHEGLLVTLLKLRNPDLALALIDQTRDTHSLGELEFEPLEWWLDWIAEKDATNRLWLLRDRISSLLATQATAATQRMLLAELNTNGSRFRSILAEKVLSRRVDLSTDDLPGETVEFLLARLHHGEHGLLGSAASESFARDRLLPLLPTGRGRFAASLRAVLREAGKRHGRRYVGDPVAKTRLKPS